MEYIGKQKQVIDAFLSSKKVATAMQYRTVLEEFFSFLGAVSFWEVTQDSVTSYVLSLSKKVEEGVLTESTKQKKLRVLSSFYNFLLLNGEKFNVTLLYRQNYFLHETDYTEPKISEKNVANLNDCDQLLRVTKSNPYLDMAVKLALRMRLTTSEILSLKFSDLLRLLEENPVMLVGNGPDRRGKVVPSDLAAELSSFSRMVKSENAGKEYLFSKDGKHVIERTLRRWLVASCTEAGISPLSFRAIRNTGIASFSGPAEELRADLGLLDESHLKRCLECELPISDASSLCCIRLVEGMRVLLFSDPKLCEEVVIYKKHYRMADFPSREDYIEAVNRKRLHITLVWIFVLFLLLGFIEFWLLEVMFH